MALRSSGMPLAGVYFVKPSASALAARVLDVLRRVEIRLAGAEPDDVLAFGFHLLGLGINGQSQRRTERRRALRDFVIHKPVETNKPQGRGAQAGIGGKG